MKIWKRMHGLYCPRGTVYRRWRLEDEGLVVGAIWKARGLRNQTPRAFFGRQKEIVEDILDA